MYVHVRVTESMRKLHAVVLVDQGVVTTVHAVEAAATEVTVRSQGHHDFCYLVTGSQRNFEAVTGHRCSRQKLTPCRSYRLFINTTYKYVCELIIILSYMCQAASPAPQVMQVYMYILRYLRAHARTCGLRTL